jgi:hypothetical protein
LPNRDLTVSSLNAIQSIFFLCKAFFGGSIADFLQCLVFFECGALLVSSEKSDILAYLSNCMFARIGRRRRHQRVASSSIPNCDFIRCRSVFEGGALVAESSLLCL